MVRIKLFLEGQTEEDFVKQVLNPIFSPQGIYFFPILAGISAKQRGGIVSYDKTKRELVRLCKQDKKAKVSTLIDYYGLPNEFPGIDDLKGKTIGNENLHKTIEELERKLEADIDQPNFIANYMIHEFEALLFCQPEKFSDCFGDDGNLELLLKAKNEFPTPEHINNSRITAPSKRILSVIPNYKKRLHGPRIAKAIGLDTMRQQCLHFHQWLEKIEAL